MVSLFINAAPVLLMDNDEATNNKMHGGDVDKNQFIPEGKACQIVSATAWVRTWHTHTGYTCVEVCTRVRHLVRHLLSHCVPYYSEAGHKVFHCGIE